MAPMDVHHRTYKRLGRERMSDLDVLCRAHHDIWHFLQKVDRYSRKKWGKQWRKKVTLERAIKLYQMST